MTAKRENVYAELANLRRMINWLQDDVQKLQHRLAALEGSGIDLGMPSPSPQYWWPPGWTTAPDYTPIVFGRL